MKSSRPIVAMLGIIALVGSSAGSMSRTQDRRNQEIKAPQLLGKAGKGKMKNTCSSLSAGLGTQGIIRKWLEEEDYASKLHETAKKVGKAGADCSAQSIYFPIEQPAPIARIQELLGKEEARTSGEVTLNDKTRQLSWYEYGWISFGVEGDSVTVVQIDFKKSGLT